MQNKFAAIPEELRQLRYWVVWKYVDIGAKKLSKEPFDPKTGTHADVTDPSTWSGFEEAFNAYQLGKYDGLGFVFHETNPYGFIDLDDAEGNTTDYDRQVSIYKQFDSYAEKSPSGSGLHIIIKGKIPSGKRRNHIEIYSHARYATMTGEVFNIKPIKDYNIEFNSLWEQMGGSPTAPTHDGNAPETATDQEIITKALGASNGDKFEKLLNGKWQEIYTSQSEADFAFIDIIAFYTQNREQIKRIFRASPLGQRKKAARNDYVEWMVNKSFDNLPPPIDFEGFQNNVNQYIGRIAQSVEPVPHKNLVTGSSPVAPTNAGSFNGRTAPFEGVNGGSSPSPVATSSKIIKPSGLLGEIADFIYNAAPRPVPEIALAGAIGLMAGICGKAFNVSNTGLNQYILLLAKTGMGKEGMAQGIDKLMNAIAMQVPTVNEFIGPSYIASGQALVKYVHKKSNCFVSILGEFGLRLQGMSSQNASTHEKMLKQILLELYNKSGHSDVYRASIHADFEKNTEVTKGPAFSLLGESNPHSFYSALSEDMIAEGLLPRFLMIEYDGNRPDLNKQYHTIAPPIPLVERLATLAAVCKNAIHSQTVITVGLDNEAMEISDNFDKFATSRINQTKNNEVVLQLWNRAHLKALKLAALVAVGNHPYQPIITKTELDWAINMVQNDIISLSQKFEIGEIGTNTGENKQLSELVRVIKEYIVGSWEEVHKYSIKTDNNVVKKIMHDNRVIPYAYIQRRLAVNTSYKNDKMGATFALKRTLQTLLESDKLREVPKNELATRFGTTQKAFIVSDLDLLN